MANVGRHAPTPLLAMLAEATRRISTGRYREGLSTVAGRGGGPARSSGEAPVIGVEQRGRVVCGCCSVGQPGEVVGRSWVDELKSSGKSFVISKWEVQEAWERVRANKGAPGVDGCSIGEFEKDLRNNLFRIWNRMSSGSYFPPPVRAVEIPKSQGGTRVLGVPTEAA